MKQSHINPGDRVRCIRGPRKGAVGVVTHCTWENACYVQWVGDDYSNNRFASINTCIAFHEHIERYG